MYLRSMSQFMASRTLAEENGFNLPFVKTAGLKVISL